MATIRKFFDREKREVPPEEAVSCHEIETDSTGRVVRDSWYFTEEDGVVLQSQVKGCVAQETRDNSDGGGL